MSTAEQSPGAVREQVRARYADAAVAVTQREQAACCGPADDEGFGARLYAAGDRADLPDAAVLASLGCGNPTAVADLREGETVLDLGSGGGIDVLLSAGRVGPAGKAYGLDMTDEMLDLARRNAAEASAANVEFLRGHIEAVPLPDASVDVVISNCVINLSADKPAVLAEMFRVLRPGGRVGVSDVVAEDRLSPDDRAERGSYVGCIAGALSKGEYERGLAAAGFGDVSVTFTHQVADGLHGAIVKAVKPRVAPTVPQALAHPVAAGVLPAVGDCCSTASQATCCESSQKSSCCGSSTSGPGGCGCR
jgi:ubiquinone/menaquinone biosynthesis C-methylase UbiE